MPGMTTIADTVTAWPGVTAGPGRRGEYSFKLGAREIGHLHGERVAHFGFPKDVGQELFDAGRIDSPPVSPGGAGFGAGAIGGDEDAAEVIALMRLNYDRIVARHGLPE